MAFDQQHSQLKSCFHTAPPPYSHSSPSLFTQLPLPVHTAPLLVHTVPPPCSHSSPSLFTQLHLPVHTAPPPCSHSSTFLFTQLHLVHTAPPPCSHSSSSLFTQLPLPVHTASLFTAPPPCSHIPVHTAPPPCSHIPVHTAPHPCSHSSWIPTINRETLKIYFGFWLDLLGHPQNTHCKDLCLCHILALPFDILMHLKLSVCRCRL